ncbi:MAG: UDP-N-acetylmuramoyl-tripeptide--D-alanyl-D-alanine ligase [Gammaproteobacteria bacterium]|nr:UDP-N-acetylmuramoyl-tripeptide--D-alanyl-D-alanine ligase [Gammaproteobacteria bacterium]
MRLSEAATYMEGTLHGPDAPFCGCSTDSRTLSAGALFFALRGGNFDGHGFLAEVRQRGAAGAVIDRALSDAPLPLLSVSDTRQALGRLARSWRRRFPIPCVAVTGSNGKTTVKELLASIFTQLAPTLSTTGNLNNDIGVPLTLFRLGNEHRFGVIEMGANHPGEIAGLTRLVEPDVAVVTQCAPAHLEGFGSVEGVARAKAEIYLGLGADGTAVINSDDAYAPLWRAAAYGRRQVTFGLLPGAEVTATRMLRDGVAVRFVLCAAGAMQPVSLPLPGVHNVMNALAAAACGVALGIAPERIAAGLESVRAVKGRLQLKAAHNSARVLDDTYNANPASLDAALAVLSEIPGRRWLVLGDMGELGARGPEFHARAGESARRAGVERMFALGELSRHAVEEFGAGASHYPSVETLNASLRPALAGDVTVLVKGSRAMSMERVVAAILPEA